MKIVAASTSLVLAMSLTLLVGCDKPSPDPSTQQTAAKKSKPSTAEDDDKPPAALSNGY
jgi:hypothetical protein